MSPPEADPRIIVKDGWNRASYLYRPEGGEEDPLGHSEDYRGWLKPLFEELPPRAKILDLGCGCGVPVAALLSDRFEVTGVDFSEVQVERARRLVPRAQFVLADMTEVEFPIRSFDAVVSLYALFHVPLIAQKVVLGRIRSWLRPEGSLVVITGHDPYEGTEQDWLGSGAPMFWSTASASTYRAWLEEFGFKITTQAFVPEGTGGHELFIARRRP